ncbi:MAG TPA: anti-sigma factor [Kofleriaceae bacterium]|nr:anti-sigma factor [Kofleriaceae bacterium]
MTCAEFHELVMHYALGALDDAERETCEAHLRQAAHPGCFEALRKASAAVALVPASLEPVAPAAGTWAAIEGALGRESDAAIADRGPTPIRARGPRRWIAQAGWLVAAAAIVAVIVLVRDRRQLTASAADDQTRRAQCLAELEQQRGDAKLRQDAIAMLQRPGTRLVALAPQAGTPSANLIYRDDETRVFVVGDGLHAPRGKALQLWAIRGEHQIREGVLRGDSSGAVHTGEIAAIRTGKLDAFGVTVEPLGGATGEHGPVVLYGKI